MDLISFCIPVHNRTYDLKKTMPYLIESANASPPVEIMILDYNSPDDLTDYIREVLDSKSLINGNCLSYAKYSGRNYYHMAHARNLSVKASSGSVIVIMSADIYPSSEFVPTIRKMIPHYAWLYDVRYRGVIAIHRQEFIDAGGYDERFEFYGPEDRDLESRLHRRGCQGGILPPGLLNVFSTPDEVKVKNYRLFLSKKEMSRQMRPIYDENVRNNVLVVNLEQGWGQWDY